jgi:hypothetical protein
MCGLNDLSTERPVDLSRSGGAIAEMSLSPVASSAPSILQHAILLPCFYRSILDIVR